MLESTFQHIQGVGEKRERQLWRRGCLSWDHLIESDYGLPCDSYRRIKAGVLESKARMESLDHHYFRERLGGNLSWRAYNKFVDDACYIDIETTGLSPGSDHVTTVCLHARRETKVYIHGRNLEELEKDLDKYRYIVSFNGARFDLPFLAGELGIRFHQIHLDLLYPLRRLGYSGGLKRIETELGIARDTEGVTGFDAVRLWKAYRNDKTVEVAGREVGGDSALDLLVEYNRDDTVNLERLAELTVSKMREEHRRHFVASPGH